jgi:hypothetical protein
MMNIIQEPNWSNEIEIPVSVAVCPDCQTKLTIHPTGWTEAGDGNGMVCDTFDSVCQHEPDIDEGGYDEFWESHPSYEMPYVYWLPVDMKIEAWLKKNYRFVEAA